MDFTNKIIGETIMSHMYALARQLQAPGVRTVATFNPMRLTKTLRNMARKSIVTGKHMGGWSSQTKEVRDLIFVLAGEKPVVYAAPAHGSYLSLCSPRALPTAIHAEIVGLLEADCALTKLSYNEERNSYYRNNYDEFIKHVDLTHKQNVARLDEILTASFSMVIRNKTLREQIVTLFVSQRTVEEIAIAERIARLLDRDEDFPVPTTYEF